MARYAVIGLGRFGMMLARSLAERGQEVIAIDHRRDLVEEVREEVGVSVRLDATDERALTAQGAQNVDVAVVCIGEDFEAAALVTSVLKSLKVARVIARAQTPIRAKILGLIGADEIVSPEDESAVRLAQRLAAPNIIDYLPLAPGHSVVQIQAPKKFHGKSIAEIDLRRKYEVNLVALKRTLTHRTPEGKEVTEEEITDVPRPTDVIQEGDILILVGSNENVSRLPAD
jgi:trk system potassium uptake protein TrkA